jgi:hypothetical protein
LNRKTAAAALASAAILVGGVAAVSSAAPIDRPEALAGFKAGLAAGLASEGGTHEQTSDPALLGKWREALAEDLPTSDGIIY